MITGSWTFEKDVAKIFDKHVAQSVPMYEEIQNLIVNISQFFIRNNDVIYDIGTSTGTTIYALKEAIQKPFKVIGIDNSIDMIKTAEDKLKGFNGIELICSDVGKYDFDVKANLIISNLTLQFIPMEDREAIINKIYNNLNQGGAFIIIEKTYAKSSIHQEIYTQLYHDFKESNELTPTDIRYKDKSLRSVLMAKKNEDNIKMLTEAGFEVDEFFRNLNFVGYLAIKI